MIIKNITIYLLEEETYMVKVQKHDTREQIPVPRGNYC